MTLEILHNVQKMKQILALWHLIVQNLQIDVAIVAVFGAVMNLMNGVSIEIKQCEI